MFTRPVFGPSWPLSLARAPFLGDCARAREGAAKRVVERERRGVFSRKWKVTTHPQKMMRRPIGQADKTACGTAAENRFV